MENKVLCFGEILWDTFGSEKKAGGAPFNVARHLAQQQIDVIMASRVGSDDAGDGLMAFVKEHNLATSLIQQDPDLPTCEVTVRLNEYNHASYFIPEPVSWDNIQPARELMQYASQANVIVFGSLACREETSCNTLLDLLDESNAMRVFDVNLRPPHYRLDTIEALAARADVIKMNEDEAELLIGTSIKHEKLRDKIIEFQKKYHAQTICVTRGEHGALIWHDEEFYEHPGYTINVEDTVGAGDSFLATLICGLLKQQPINQILPRACAVGAFVASNRGANPTYTEEAIQQIMNQNA